MRDAWNIVFTDIQRQYIAARLRTKTDVDAYKMIGLKSAHWPEKPLVDAYIKYLREHAKDTAVKMITDATIEAAAKLIEALDGRKITPRQMEAIEQILDRGGVTKVTRQEITGANAGPIEVRAVDYRNGITEVAPRSIPDSDTPGEI